MIGKLKTNLKIEFGGHIFEPFKDYDKKEVQIIDSRDNDSIGIKQYKIKGCRFWFEESCFKYIKEE